jgi:osmoprotectant transport system permease protein
VRYLIENPDDMLELLLEHIQVAGAAVLIATLIGVPIGVLLTRVRWLQGPVLGASGVLYSIPSLALFAVLIPFTGLGATTAIIALTMYSLLAIIRNTVTGIESVTPAMQDAALGMGMTDRQRLLLVELPLGLPVILGGVRLATIAAIGIATIAASVGAGGLGYLIFQGLRILDNDRVIAGALSASLLALAADWLLGRLGARLRRDAATEGGA